MMWAGDQNVDWSADDGIASVITSALSIGYSGCGIIHSDLGGFTTLQTEIYTMKRSKELFMRWAELSAFSPVMRTHEGNRPDLNWQFDSDEETLLHFARMSKIFAKLKPYLLESIKENSQNGIPLMRHPLIDYQNTLGKDEISQKIIENKTQYMLGRDLFCSPVVTENTIIKEVFLPEDSWINLWTGMEYVGGKKIIEAGTWWQHFKTAPIKESLEGLGSPIFVGKESNVFTAKGKNESIIVKIYRLENCDFNQMYDYIKEDQVQGFSQDEFESRHVATIKAVNVAHSIALACYLEGPQA